MDADRFRAGKMRRWPYRSEIRWPSTVLLVLGVGTGLAPLKSLFYSGPRSDVVPVLWIGLGLTSAGVALFALWWWLAGRDADARERMGSRSED